MNSEPNHARLDLHEVHLWYTEVPDKSRTSLTSRERKKCLASEKFLPKVLAQYPEFKKANLSFLDNGKPVIVYPSRQSDSNIDVSSVEELHCSASHSADTGLYALSLGTKIGVDIEKIISARSLDGISRSYFHPDEQLELKGLQGKAKTDRFYQFWTLKEAMGKISGKGLSGDFSRFGFHSLSPEPEQSWQALDELPGFRFWSQRFGSDYWFSVAALTEEARGCKEVRLNRL